MKRILAILVFVAGLADAGQQVVSRPWIERYGKNLSDPYWTGPFDASSMGLYQFTTGDVGQISALVNSNTMLLAPVYMTASLWNADPTNAYALNSVGFGTVLQGPQLHPGIWVTNDFSVCCWLNPASNGLNQNAMGLWTPPSSVNGAWNLRLSGGKPGITFSPVTNSNGLAEWYTASQIPSQAWTHCAVTLDFQAPTSGIVCIYTNGILSSSNLWDQCQWVTNGNYTNIYLAYPNNFPNLNVGGGLYSSVRGGWTGMLNNARIYSRMLSSSEVATVAAESRTGRTTSVSGNLECFFPFAEPMRTNLVDHGVFHANGWHTFANGIYGPEFVVGGTNQVGDVKYGAFYGQSGMSAYTRFFSSTNWTPATGLTVMCWMNYLGNDSSYGSIVAHGNGATARSWMLYIQNTNLAFYAQGTADSKYIYRYAPKPTTGTIQFVSATWTCGGTTSAIAIYTNGPSGVLKCDTQGGSAGTFDQVNSNAYEGFVGAAYTNATLTGQFNGGLFYVQIVPAVLDTATMNSYASNTCPTNYMQKVQ